MKNSNATISKINEWLSGEIEREHRLHYRYTRRLGQLLKRDLPARIQKATSKHGTGYYLEVWVEDGVTKRRYLGSENNTVVKAVKEKRFLEKALNELENNEKVLQDISGSIRRFDPETVNDSLPKAYRLNENDLRAAAGDNEEESWYSEAIKIKARDERDQSDFFIERRIHTAKDGTKMRSKSEVDIANALIDRNIKYIYEMPLTVSGLPIHPDFTFYSYSRGKVMIWEHAGMMGDEGYREDFAYRLNLYQNGGYAPNVDVIFSFDTTDGRLDSTLINRIIDEYL